MMSNKMDADLRGSNDVYSDDDIVITGISGRFPLADNIDEMKENLFSKKLCIVKSDDRWTQDSETMPDNHIGSLKDLSKFDAEFFGFSSPSAHSTDPQIRILMECSYEAVVDAGYSISELEGLNIGVFTGISDPDPPTISRDETANHGLILVSRSGFLPALSANRISHKFGFKGPSFALDSACSSSGAAFDVAFSRLKEGKLDGAIVGGASLVLDPVKSADYAEIGILSTKGESRPFDENANGFARGEAVAAIFMQRKKQSRRVYAKVLNSRCESAGNTREGIFTSNVEAEIVIARNTLEEIGLDPQEVGFVESHGTGTRVGDAIESEAISAVYCAKDRKVPLYIGAMKGNFGHSEAASGVSSVVKTIIAFETGIFPPTFGFESPRLECTSIIDGRIKVADEAMPLNSNIVGINNWGFGGVNVHILLERYRLERRPDKVQTNTIPELVIYSATTKKALDDMFAHFQQNNMTREFYFLLNKSAYCSTMLCRYRGFTILQDNAPPITSIETILPVKRQVWYVVTGMGCQWPGMGLDLMRLDVFAQSMKKSAETLEIFGISLFDLLHPDNGRLLQDRCITPAFVTIAAIQIALVDVLNALGLEPDGILGHSTGELIASYADGCCTAEQTILSAYYRGECVDGGNLPRGAMAAVGLTWEEAKRRCPEGVYPACHNAEDSVTISGLETAVAKFVEQLKAENVFARVVNTYGYSFHCPTIQSISPKLKSCLQKVYTNPKPRTKRWVSCSYDQSEWGLPACKIADAEYFCHNLESPVRFKEALSLIPSDAITIEIGPHHLLLSILKRAIGGKATCIGLMKSKENNVDFLLSSIGKLYTLGIDPKVENLYPPVSCPVPRGTPTLSSFIQWDHSESYYVPKYRKTNSKSSNIFVKCSGADSFLLDHCIDGRSLYPATGYIYLAWKALSESLNSPMEKLPILIENFKIFRATILASRDEKTFKVSLLNMSGDFEIVEGGSVAASGKISHPTKPMFEENGTKFEEKMNSISISGQEMYNELKIHGYEYGPAFQGLLEVNIDGTEGKVKWDGEWISFLDSLLLFFGIIYENSDFKLPTGALSVKIDPNVHWEFLSLMAENGLKGVPVKYDKDVKKCSTPGVEIRNLSLDPASHRALSEVLPVLEEYSFHPNTSNYLSDPEQCDMFKNYLQACALIANDIIISSSKKEQVQKLLREINLDNDIFQKLVSTPAENHVVLGVMQDLAQISLHKNSESKIQTMCHRVDRIIAADFIFTLCLQDKSFRSVLDVVVENSFGKLKVIEYCNDGPQILPSVQNLMNQFSQAKARYTLLHSISTEVSVDSTNEDIQFEKMGQNGDIPTDYKAAGDLVLTCFLLGDSQSLDLHICRTAEVTKDRGFVIMVHKQKLTPPEHIIHLLSNRTDCPVQTDSEIEKLFVKENLAIVSKMSSPSGVTIYLLRKINKRLSQPSSVLPVNILDGKYKQWVDELKNCMSVVQGKNEDKIVWILAQDTLTNGTIGMINCLKQEPGGDKIRCLFTDSSAPSFDIKNPFFREMLRNDLLMNVFKDGQWGSYRHTTLPDGDCTSVTDMAYIDCLKFGDLSSFRWLESPVKYIQCGHPERNLYQIYYSSLNFRDVMLATGKLSTGAISGGAFKAGEPCLGMEFSGRDKNGVRVMGITESGALANVVLAEPYAVYEIPKQWSLEEAATVPIVYITCYFALIIRGRLSKGEKILIHSGTGGIGQAAIRIALSLDCDVFATVGNEEKRNFLLETFPQLKPEKIGCSRDTSFEEMVLRQTKGKGVNVVLNSLADDKLQASVRCLAKHGRFLEIGKYDLSMDSKLGMRVFLKDVSFCSVMLDVWFCEEQPEKGIFLQSLKDLMLEGIKKGVVQPLKRTVFNKDQVEDAFRYMGSGRHIGKVLLKIRDEEERKMTTPQAMKMNVSRKLHLYLNKCYVIIGGLGGFGIELAKWLVQKGAGTVILTSRYGARTPYHNLCLKRWQESGANVLVSTLNVTKREEAELLIKEASVKYGAVGGIFNSAVVLRDAFIENQSATDFESVSAPKALATKHLDELTRQLCPQLDMFVCFSSISCGKGNAGQTNYGYANSVMERICEQRHKDGLHGLAIQWGIIGDVGLVHRNMGEDAMIAGVMSQKIISCLLVLERFLLQNKPVVSSFVTADKSRNKKSDNILTQLSHIFNVPDIDQVNPYRTFGEMGMDSMFGVELKQLLESAFTTTFSIQEVQNMKIADIKNLVEEQESLEKSVSNKVKRNNISFNGPSKLLPIEPLILLNKDQKGTPLFVVHGNDLSFPKLQNLWDNMDYPVHALQYTKDSPNNSLKDLALWYLDQMRKVCPNGPVNLASFSTAANLAIEMAVLSEKTLMPIVKNLVVLDGSLELMDIHTVTEQEKIKNSSLNEISDICQFLAEFSDSDLSQLQDELKPLPNLESRLNTITSLILSIDKSAFIEAVELYVEKQNLMRRFLPSAKLVKNLTIVEASEKVLPNDVSVVKSFLGEICSGQVTIHRLRGYNEFLLSSESSTEVTQLLSKLFNGK